MKSPARPRRERPAKPALTREGIVDAALAVMRAEGLGKVTMRRVAAALDTGAASLYVYVRDTADLHARILDALLSGLVPAGGPDGGWQERLKALLRRYMAVLYAHPAIARMAMSTLPSGPHYTALVDAVLGLLNEGGVADREAAWGVDLLLLLATASAAEHGTWTETPRIDAQFSALGDAIATIDRRRYPHIARLGAELLTGGPERTDWALDVLIAGIAATPRPA